MHLELYVFLVGIFTTVIDAILNKAQPGVGLLTVSSEQGHGPGARGEP